jgi:hypothetical protein
MEHTFKQFHSVLITDTVFFLNRCYVRCRVVSDAKGVGLAHIKHSQLMRDVIAIGQKNYPELVQTVVVVRAPVYMHTLWNFGVKWVLDERVKRKVTIAGKNFEKRMILVRQFVVHSPMLQLVIL